MNNILESQPISYDTTPMYENDWNGINGGQRTGRTTGTERTTGTGRTTGTERTGRTLPGVYGGEPIASGGYGCVFKPALQCKSTPGKRQPGKITKLMLKKYAEREYQEIHRFQTILSSIPNYTHYFLLNDFTLCQPAPLSPEDLQNFDKCRALKKDNINEKNMNQSLDKLLALTMPDGGIAVDDYIRKITKYSDFIELNHRLVELLNQGIVPMNHKHIYHSDIKDSNVLVQEKEKETLDTRLIDWGISVEYQPTGKFPPLWTNRPFQFNTPFSTILFSDLFKEKYAAFMKTNPAIDSANYKEVLGAFVIDYIYLWMKKRGPGHYKAINNMFYILFMEDLKNMDKADIENVIETNYTLVYIKNYLTEIIYHFSKGKGLFDIESYLNKVFIKIIDVWGFISIYFCILEELFEFRDTLTENEKELFQKLKQIVLIYLYNPRITPISISKLSKDLKNLNQYFGEEMKAKNDTSHFLVLKSNSTKKSSMSKKKRFQTLVMVTTTTSSKKTQTKKMNQTQPKTQRQTRKKSYFHLLPKMIR